MASNRVVVALVMLLTLAAAARAQQTTITPGATPVAINNGPGGQTDAHISGTLVSYTSALNGRAEIRYFDFATGVDRAIPQPDTALDFLSNVSGPIIVFTRIDALRMAICSFDTSTAGPVVELDSQPGSNRQHPAIGGQTVAWQDLGFSIDTDINVVSEIVAYDRVTATSVRITTDADFDRNPAVSPDGNVIVWEKCATSTLPCDIYQAVKSAGGWTVSPLTTTPDSEATPHTNGTLVVYAVSRAADPWWERDICWTPVGGGPETQLVLPGDQRNPNISGDVITFESRNLADPLPDWGLYAYDISTQILYRLTAPPTLDEYLNAVSVTGNEAHVVYTTLESDENVYAQTFTLVPGQYDFTGTGGFQSPIANAPAVNVVSAGRVVPIKWQLRDAGGAYVSDLDVVTGVLVQPVPCGTLTTDFDNAVAADTSGHSGLRYDRLGEPVHLQLGDEQGDGGKLLRLRPAAERRQPVPGVFPPEVGTPAPMAFGLGLWAKV